ncbi:hypothetical protein D3C73_1623600 [compost metagenome]
MNAVLAASSSTQAVAAWMMKNRMLPPPNVAEAICAIRLGCGFEQSKPIRSQGFSA